jgi:hypothetical protein
VLFSNPQVSAYVREHFVAAWEGVRPVPTVEIDFGNGKKIKRTVNGNIATYLCTPDGRVLDIIPGLNTPESYLGDLKEAVELYRSTFARREKILDHHLARATTSKAPRSGADGAKTEVERPIRPIVRDDVALLQADTRINREERKPLVHRLLAEKSVRPAEITKRVYKEILHCDLDDPYLGLVTTAFNGGAYESR